MSNNKKFIKWSNKFFDNNTSYKLINDENIFKSTNIICICLIISSLICAFLFRKFGLIIYGLMLNIILINLYILLTIKRIYEKKNKLVPKSHKELKKIKE